MKTEVMSKVQEHTLEYFSSSKLYKSMIKQSSEDGDSVIDIVRTHNNSEENLPAKAELLPVKSEMLWEWCKPNILYFF